MTEKTILVVDDSEFERTMLCKAMATKGQYRFVEAGTGEECLALLESTPVDLVVLDNMLPGMSGLEALQSLRKKLNAVELPVVMVTGKSETSDVVEGLRHGANDYVTKPVNFDVVASRINTQLRLAELSKEMHLMHQMVALDALIVTYNHEINNPLMVAMACMDSPSWPAEDQVQTLRGALWRIADIVKKISEVSEKREVTYQAYVGGTKRLKLK